MRIVIVVVGIVLACFGALWTLQGLGIAPGGFMYQNPTWIVIGLVVLVIGIGVAGFGARKPKPRA